MNLKYISDAISSIEPEFISESMEIPAIFAESKTARKPVRRAVAIIAAVCLVLALSVTAYAMNIPGIRELLGFTYEKLPPEAEQYIVQHSEIIEGEHWNCRVTESLTAGDAIMVVLNITCDNDYILFEGDEIPAAEEIAAGIDSFSYAEKQGRIPLYVNADIMCEDNTLSGYAWSVGEKVSDSELNILIRRDKQTADDVSEITCVLHMREIRLESGEKIYDESVQVLIPLTIFDASVTENPTYIPD